MNGALVRYRAMAYIVGIGLIVLVFVGVPLQYGAGEPAVVKIVGPVHGMLYIVYLLTALDLARRARFSIPQMMAMVGAGFVPFLAFIVERRITSRITSQGGTAHVPDPAAGANDQDEALDREAEARRAGELGRTERRPR